MGVELGLESMFQYVRVKHIIDHRKGSDLKGTELTVSCQLAYMGQSGCLTLGKEFAGPLKIATSKNKSQLDDVSFLGGHL